MGRTKNHGKKVNNLVQNRQTNNIEDELNDIVISELILPKKQGKKRRRNLEIKEDRIEARQDANKAYWERNKDTINEKRREDRKTKRKVSPPTGSHDAPMANLTGTINGNKFVAVTIDDMISQYEKDSKPIQTLWIRGDGAYTTLQSSHCRQKKAMQVEKHRHEFLQRMTNLVSALGGWTADEGRLAILQLKDVINVVKDLDVVKKAFQEGAEQGQKQAMTILTNHWKNVAPAITKGLTVLNINKYNILFRYTHIK